MRKTVDRSVALRQAFGSHFEPTAQDRGLADAITSGQLTLKPHAKWLLPADPDWSEDPFNDGNWQFQYHTLRWLDPLRRRGLEGDSSAVRAWEHYVRSWIENNEPGKSPTKWAWTDMADAMRTLTLVFGMPMFNDAKWLEDALFVHGSWLAEAANLGVANHALHQHQALFVVGRLLRHREWTEVACDRIRQLFVESYDEEGINAEGSIGYHDLNYRWWTLAMRRLEVEGVAKLADAERLELALEALAHATRPDGQYERIGDIDSGGPRNLPSPYLDYVVSGGEHGEHPPGNVAVYKRGYVFGRSGWGSTARPFADESFYSLSFGPANRVHGHQDGGSLTFFADGVPWITDTGKYTYGPGPMRAYVLRRPGHNVIDVPQQAYAADSNVRLAWANLSQDSDVFMMLDRGYENVTLQRQVVYCRHPDVLLIRDTVVGTDIVQADQLWHLNHSVEASRDGDGYVLSDATSRARICWIGEQPELSEVEGSTKPFEGWVSTGWKQKSPATVLKASATGKRFQFVTVIGSITNTDFLIRTSSLEGDLFSIELVRGDRSYHIEIDSEHARVSPRRDDHAHSPDRQGQ